MKVTVLGCGSSMGVPAAGGFWGICDPKEPRNYRTRASLLLQTEKTNVVVDATYDLRTHLNEHPIKKLHGLLLSHYHNDHISGIEDLRALSYNNNAPIDFYTNKETLEALHVRFPHLMTCSNHEIYTPCLSPNAVEQNQKFSIGDIEVETFDQDHTTCITLGFRFGNFAYSVDVANLDDNALNTLKGIDTWIVDGGAYMREKITTHANLQRVFKWVDIIKPKMTYITVLSSHMDYQTLCEELPPHIRPAYDGMVIEMDGNLR